ncbi:DUF202 domain-containing protein [bacterium]|nr:DUF202 domain-containing protein [candidate division CSSED10-310 bacterium]
MSPYQHFLDCELILRDELAIDRTNLANERTLLAYLRSSIALVIAGISIIHFSQEFWYGIMGLACVPLGCVTGIIGVVRYARMRRSIAHIRRHGSRALPGAESSMRSPIKHPFLQRDET